MNNQLFKVTRQRLALYSGGMITVILTLGAIAFYEAIIHAHRLTIDQELKTVAATIHDGLGSILQQPGQWESEASRLLPSTCVLPNTCSWKTHSIVNDKYYVQLFSLSGKLLVTGGMQPVSEQMSKETWQTLTGKKGDRYRQIWFGLHTKTGENWGYLQVGRNIQDFDHYMRNLTWLILLVLPLIVVLVGISAWWLAGISIHPLYQSYQKMQQFTSDAAHELRTPLASLQATIESSLMSEENTREILLILDRQTKRLITLVRDLLTLSRLDWQLNQVNELIFEDLCLQDLINDLIEELSPLALKNEVQLTAIFNVSNDVFIKGNSEQIYRLFSNLITNAINYNYSGGKVTIILEKINQKVLIHVQDTGIGIDNQQLTHIFDRFYRINQARSRDQGGAGLGLAICDAIVQNHQGKMQVKSELKKGSIFTVEFLRI
jgi:signal transduction histidine kinase